MSYRLRSPVEATQWFKNGDHPWDAVGELLTEPLDGATYRRKEGRVVRYYRHPDVLGDTECALCGNVMHDHGWIDQAATGLRVCPGDWVVDLPAAIEVDENVITHLVIKPATFAATYEPV